MTDERDYGVAVISYADEDSGVEFRWHGGAYIDVCFAGEAQDVINVWDDEQDRSTFEVENREAGYREPQNRPFRMILEAFEARCQAWLAEVDEDATV